MNDFPNDENHAALLNNWDADQNDLNQITTDLYNRFGTNPNGQAADYMTALRAAVSESPKLFRFTVKMMMQIADDVDEILKDVYQAKWTQAANYVSVFMRFTTFALKQ